LQSPDNKALSRDDNLIVKLLENFVQNSTPDHPRTLVFLTDGKLYDSEEESEAEDLMEERESRIVELLSDSSANPDDQIHFFFTCPDDTLSDGIKYFWRTTAEQSLKDHSSEITSVSTPIAAPKLEFHIYPPDAAPDDSMGGNGLKAFFTRLLENQPFDRSWWGWDWVNVADLRQNPNLRPPVDLPATMVEYQSSTVTYLTDSHVETRIDGNLPGAQILPLARCEHHSQNLSFSPDSNGWIFYWWKATPVTFESPYFGFQPTPIEFSHPTQTESTHPFTINMKADRAILWSAWTDCLNLKAEFRLGQTSIPWGKIEFPIVNSPQIEVSLNVPTPFSILSQTREFTGTANLYWSGGISNSHLGFHLNYSPILLTPLPEVQKLGNDRYEIHLPFLYLQEMYYPITDVESPYIPRLYFDEHISTGCRINDGVLVGSSETNQYSYQEGKNGDELILTLYASGNTNSMTNCQSFTLAWADWPLSFLPAPESITIDLQWDENCHPHAPSATPTGSSLPCNLKITPHASN
jgi:hypothetical protein